METAILTIAITVAFILLCMVILAFIGLSEKKREREYLDQYNRESIQSFMNGRKSKKYARKSTPKVPTINK